MSADEQDLCYDQLIAGLRLLAASADVQLSILPDYVYVPDEVLSSFGNTYCYLPQLRRAGRIDDAGAKAIEEVDACLDAIPDDPALDDPESLRSHAFWEGARALARKALAELNESTEGPAVLSFYVRANE